MNRRLRRSVASGMILRRSLLFLLLLLLPVTDVQVG